MFLKLKRISKDIKATLKIKVDELDHKLKLKRIGSDEFKSESSELIRQVNMQLTQLDINNKEDKKKISALNKDKTTIEERIAKTDGIFISIGGQLMEEEARQLILKKLYNMAEKELSRYLNAEKRGMINSVENLWDKYAISSQEIELERSHTINVLKGFLQELGYGQ